MQEEKIFLRWIWQILSHGTQERKITQALAVEDHFVLFLYLVHLQAKKTVSIRTHPWHVSTDHKLCTSKTSDSQSLLQTTVLFLSWKKPAGLKDRINPLLAGITKIGTTNSSFGPQRGGVQRATCSV